MKPNFSSTRLLPSWSCHNTSSGSGYYPVHTLHQRHDKIPSKYLLGPLTSFPSCSSIPLPLFSLPPLSDVGIGIHVSLFHCCIGTPDIGLFLWYNASYEPLAAISSWVCMFVFSWCMSVCVWPAHLIPSVPSCILRPLDYALHNDTITAPFVITCVMYHVQFLLVLWLNSSIVWKF